MMKRRLLYGHTASWHLPSPPRTVTRSRASTMLGRACSNRERPGRNYFSKSTWPSFRGALEIRKIGERSGPDASAPSVEGGHVGDAVIECHIRSLTAIECTGSRVNLLTEQRLSRN